MLKLRKDQVREILDRTFPNYKGRSFRLEITESVYIDPYGGGGTWSKYFLLDTATDRVAPYRIPEGGPFRDDNAFKSHALPSNAVLIEHRHFCGHDMGIVFHVNPSQSNAQWAAIVEDGATRKAISA